MKNLFSIASLSRDGLVIPVTENFAARKLGISPSQPKRRPELSNRSRHARYAIQMYYRRMGSAAQWLMTLTEILRAVDEGLPVHWQNAGYLVERSSNGVGCVIRSLSTGHCIGLTWADGITLNGMEQEFFIGDGTTLLPRF